MRIIFLIIITFLFGCGGGGGSSTSSVPQQTTPISPTNSAPSASNINLIIDEDTQGTGSINASDADGDSINYSIQTNTQNGLLSLNDDGTFSYTPNINFFGSDSATIVVSDGKDTSSMVINIIINDIIDNSAPVANIAFKADITASIPVELSATSSTDPDANDTLTYLWSLSSPQYSKAEIDDPSSENIIIRPDAIGEYVLSLTVTDNDGASNSTSLSFIPKLPKPLQLPDYPPLSPPDAVIKDKVDAVRLLKQSTFGPSLTSVDELLTLGAEGWFQKQKTMDKSTWDALRDIVGTSVGDPKGAPNGREWIPELFLETAQNSPDQLRHRIAYVLSQLFVVSTRTDLGHRDNAFTTYWDTLASHAFGNFRDLLENITTHPTMGHYLNMMGNKKTDLENNIRPDENFAREVMQLFTIGLKELNQDGTVKVNSANETIETYNQEVVQNYAAVFTGWYYDSPDKHDGAFGCSVHCWPYDVSGKKMVPWEQFHQKTEKHLLNDYYVPPGQTAQDDLKIALDSLFYHPNLAPFFAQHLIRQMVTSNPSPEYVSRVSAVFNNNGTGVRGDIGATVKAVLFDQEARSPSSKNVSLFGKIKEPIMMVTHMNRLFNIELLSEPDANADSLWGSNIWFRIARDPSQMALNSESVFNFFRPNFSPNGVISEMGLVAPEMQITTEANLVTDIEMFNSYTTRKLHQYEIDAGWRTPSDFSIGYDFTDVDKIWDEKGYSGVVDFLNLYLTGNRMSTRYKDVLLSLEINPNYSHVFDGEDPSWDDTFTDRLERHQFITDIIYLVISTPEFRVQH